MGIWIFHKSAPLIKSFSSYGNVIHRWVNFQNLCFPLLLQKNQYPLTISLISHLWQHTKMFNIQKRCKFPIEHQSHKRFAIINQIKMVCVIVQNGSLRRCFPLFMVGKTVLIQFQSTLIHGVRLVCHTFKMQNHHLFHWNFWCGLPLSHYDNGFRYLPGMASASRTVSLPK